MKYIILNVTLAEGKKPTKLELQEADSEKTYKNVAVWPTDWPNARWAINELAEGVIEEKQNGQYLNVTLKPLGSPKHYSSNKAAINEAMHKKEVSIGKFQENKEASIKIASTFSSATQLTVAWAEGKLGMSEAELKDQWTKFRIWLLGQYDTDPNDKEIPY